MLNTSVATLVWVILFAVLSACANTGTGGSNSAEKTPKNKAMMPAPLSEIQINTAWRHQYYLDTPVLKRAWQHTWALQGETLALATKKGKIRLIHTRSGKTIGLLRTPFKRISALAYAPSLLIVANKQGQVMAFDPSLESNAPLEPIHWQVTLSGEILARPLILERQIIIRTLDGKVYALNRHNGNILWSHEKAVPALTLHGTSSPVLHEDKLVIGFDDGQLVALNAHTGRALWKTNIAIAKGLNAIERLIDIDSTPVIDSEAIYVSAYQTRTVALASESGRILWENKQSSFRDLSLSAQTLYLLDNANRVHALDKTSGISRWVQKEFENQAVLTKPLLYQNTLVVGDTNGYLHFLQKDTGQILSSIRLSKTPLRLLIKAQARLIVLAEDGKMTAVTLNTAY